MLLLACLILILVLDCRLLTVPLSLTVKVRRGAHIVDDTLAVMGDWYLPLILSDYMNGYASVGFNLFFEVKPLPSRHGRLVPSRV